MTENLGLNLVNVEVLSIESVGSKPYVDFKTLVNNAPVPAEGYLLNSSGEYHLYYVQSFTSYLENGVLIHQGDGFVITKNVYNDAGVKRAAQQSTAFYQVTGRYSEITLAQKEEVVEGYNTTLEGEEVETTVEIDDRTVEGRGLTPTEKATQEKKKAEEEYLQKARTTLNEEELIREESFTLTYDGASIRRNFTMRIYEMTTGTERNPTKSYTVEEVNPENPEYNQVKWSVTTDTLEQAKSVMG